MTSPRDGMARSVQVRLARRAREISADPNLVLTRYAIERFLHRLACSPYANQFVLKGALMLLVWFGESFRPTRDADLLGFGALNDEQIRHMFGEICRVSVADDGLTFHAETMTLTPIRDDDDYGGKRVSLQARMGAARIGIQIDIGIGDAVEPGPQWIDYPTLLDMPRPRLRAYPREAVIAEKLHAMTLLGLRNSRMKDYYDLHALLSQQPPDPSALAKAIVATFDRRRTSIPSEPPTGLSDRFALDPDKLKQWRVFCDRAGLIAPELPTVVLLIRDSLAPVLALARRPASNDGPLTPPPPNTPS